MTHTPGPWNTIPNQGSFGHGSHPPVGNLDGVNHEADRALLLAAPELLEACKAALPYLADHIAMTLDEGPGDRIALDLVEAAIAKAEGK